MEREDAEYQLRIVKKDLKQGFIFPKEWQELIEVFEYNGYKDLAAEAQKILDGWKAKYEKDQKP